MARPPRIDRVDGYYHVTSRGNARSVIFFRDEDRVRFIERLRDNLETFNIILFAYVLMDNHFHLVVQTPMANLSKFMQRLKTSYALYARYRQKRPGHIFQGRFRAKLIESEKYLGAVTRYVHLNPVKTRAGNRLSPNQRRQLLEKYRWNSYRVYSGDGVVEEFVRADRVLSLFSSHRGAARRAYGKYVEDGLMKTDQETLSLMKGDGMSIGSVEFVEEIQEELSGRRTGEKTDEDLDLPRRFIDMETKCISVAQWYGMEEKDLRVDGRRVGEAKSVAVELACRLSGETQRSIGAYFGGVSSSAIGQLRGKIRLEKESNIRTNRLDVIRNLEHEILDAEL
jgi:putative transposase